MTKLKKKNVIKIFSKNISKLLLKILALISLMQNCVLNQLVDKNHLYINNEPSKQLVYTNTGYTV